MNFQNYSIDRALLELNLPASLDGEGPLTAQDVLECSAREQHKMLLLAHPDWLPIQIQWSLLWWMTTQALTVLPDISEPELRGMFDKLQDPKFTPSKEEYHEFARSTTVRIAAKFMEEISEQERQVYSMVLASFQRVNLLQNLVIYYRLRKSVNRKRTRRESKMPSPMNYLKTLL